MFSPYLGYLFATGGLRAPSSTYPYGFADPERALYVLSLLGRGLSVVYTAGTVTVAYGIARRLFSVEAARLAAWLVATCYPVVFYAHTMNADASYLFWILLALYCGVAASTTERVGAWTALGAAAAMAVSTKEQAFGFLLPLPLLAIGFAIPAARGGDGKLYRRILAMAAAAIVTVILANNILLNPLGFVARIAYLLGHPLTPVDAPLKPVAFAWFKGWLEWTYLEQFWDGLDSAMGTAMAWLAVAATVAVLRLRRVALWLILPALGYYYLSLRGQQLITMRYSLPIILVAIILVAGFLAQLRHATAGLGRQAVTALVLILAALSLARGVELDLLLAGDPRYRAEAWMGAHLAQGARGEAYQKQTYLPRPLRHVQLTEIPAAQRSIAALEDRRPDFIVLSSVSPKSISHVWNPDWRTTGDLLVLLPDADRMVRALEGGALPYRQAIVLRQQPRLIRPRITGLSPEIAIYVRADSHESS